MFLWWAYVCLTTMYYTTSHLHQVFSIPLGFCRFFRSYFVLPNFWSVRNSIKQLFHSSLLDMRLVIANSALRASLTLYHFISNVRSWNNCSLFVIIGLFGREEWWRSGESTSFSLVCLGFESQTCNRMWVQFVTVLYSGTRGFSSLTPQNDRARN